MQIKFCSLFCLLMLAVTCYGQTEDTTQSHSPYWNSFAVGMLSGDGEVMTGSLTTVHGVAVNRWRLGIGLGIEGFEGWRVIPLFASASVDFGSIKDNSLYLQANAGHSFGRKLEKIEGSTKEQEEGGLMLNTMVGYRIETEKLSIHIAAGYKFQRMKYQFEGYYGWYYGQHTINQEFNRFMIQIGFGFN